MELRGSPWKATLDSSEVRGLRSADGPREPEPLGERGGAVAGAPSPPRDNVASMFVASQNTTRCFLRNLRSFSANALAKSGAQA